MQVERGLVIVIHEEDLSDGDGSVIGVATTRDNTLGEWSSRIDFYFVRWITDEEMWQIDTIFTAFRKELRKTLSWWVRLTSDFEA